VSIPSLPDQRAFAHLLSLVLNAIKFNAKLPQIAPKMLSAWTPPPLSLPHIAHAKRTGLEKTATFHLDAPTISAQSTEFAVTKEDAFALREQPEPIAHPPQLASSSSFSSSSHKTRNH